MRQKSIFENSEVVRNPTGNTHESTVAIFVVLKGPTFSRSGPRSKS